MDQSISLQGQDDVWLAKLAMLGCTVDTYEKFYFVYVDGSIKVCGQDLMSLSKTMISNFEKGLYK
jgi:hypothetical protein